MARFSLTLLTLVVAMAIVPASLQQDIDSLFAVEDPESEAFPNTPKEKYRIKTANSNEIYNMIKAFYI